MNSQTSRKTNVARPYKKVAESEKNISGTERNQNI